MRTIGGTKKFSGDCEILVKYQRTEQGVYHNKMKIDVPQVVRFNL